MQNKSSPQALFVDLKIQVGMLHQCIEKFDITVPTKLPFVNRFDPLHSVTNRIAVMKYLLFSRFICLFLPLTDLKAISLIIIKSGMMPQLQDFHRGIPMYTEQEFYCNT
jgi:hypothetical protein